GRRLEFRSRLTVSPYRRRRTRRRRPSTYAPDDRTRRDWRGAGPHGVEAGCFALPARSDPCSSVFTTMLGSRARTITASTILNERAGRAWEGGDTIFNSHPSAAQPRARGSPPP